MDTNEADNLYKTGVRPIVDELMMKKAEERRDYGDYWSASSAGYCMRKVIFDRLGVPQRNQDPRKQKVFEAGHIFHEWLQRETKAAGVSVAQELRLVDNKNMVMGHFDDLIKTSIGLTLYDYKTANSRSFTYKKGKPMSHYHRMQLGTYLDILKRLVEGDDTIQVLTKDKDGNYTLDVTEKFVKLIKSLDGVKDGRILTISKDDLRMEENQLLWNGGLSASVNDYWQLIEKYWQAKKLPSCTCGEYEKNEKTGMGFMADPKYNPYFFDGEPCSLTWYKLFKEGKTDEYK